MLEHDRNQRRNAVIEQRSEFEARLKRIRAKELRQKQRYENGESRSKRIVRYLKSYLKPKRLSHHCARKPTM